MRNNPPRVFLLYCKDPDLNDGACDDVLSFADLLSKCGGLKCEFDGYDDNHELNWDAWTQRMIEECDFVLLICSHKLISHFRDPKHVLVDMTKGKFWADAMVNHIDARKFIPVFLNSDFDSICVPAGLKAATHYELRVSDLEAEMEGTVDEQFNQRIEVLLQEQRYSSIAALLAFLRGEDFAARPPPPSQPVKVPVHQG